MAIPSNALGSPWIALDIRLGLLTILVITYLLHFGGEADGEGVELHGLQRVEDDVRIRFAFGQLEVRGRTGARRRTRSRL
jgi:hypothetical protein